MPGAGAKKNACNQATFPRQNLEPLPATRDFAKYEKAGDLPFPLPSRAIAKARAGRSPHGRAERRIPGCAKVHPHSAHALALPARLRADRIAVTSRADHILVTANRGGRPEAKDNACH